MPSLFREYKIGKTFSLMIASHEYLAINLKCCQFNYHKRIWRPISNDHTRKVLLMLLQPLSPKPGFPSCCNLTFNFGTKKTQRPQVNKREKKKVKCPWLSQDLDNKICFYTWHLWLSVYRPTHSIIFSVVSSRKIMYLLVIGTFW